MTDDGMTDDARRSHEMTASDVTAARERLGHMWGAGRPLSRAELARTLGLSPKNGDDHVSNMEKGKSLVSGPIALLLKQYLAGATPFDDQEIFKMRGLRRINPETGHMPDPTPRRRRKGEAEE